MLILPIADIFITVVRTLNCIEEVLIMPASEHVTAYKLSLVPRPSHTLFVACSAKVGEGSSRTAVGWLSDSEKCHQDCLC